MTSAHFFVIYANAAGTNVTLSPRQPAGDHIMPTFNSSARVTLLEGSGIADGVMTANVRCKYRFLLLRSLFFLFVAHL